jgi:hypothetical protein
MSAPVPPRRYRGLLQEAGERAFQAWFERGFDQLVRYLEKHAAFQEYCRRHGLV